MKTFFLFLLLSIFLLNFISAGELRVTEEHPFLINGSWVSALDLKVGDELTLLNGSKVKITKLTDFETEEPFLVYNLEAGEYHNFVVGEEGVVVHNSDSIAVFKASESEDMIFISASGKGGGVSASLKKAEEIFQKQKIFLRDNPNSARALSSDSFKDFLGAFTLSGDPVNAVLVNSMDDLSLSMYARLEKAGYKLKILSVPEELANSGATGWFNPQSKEMIIIFNANVNSLSLNNHRTIVHELRHALNSLEGRFQRIVVRTSFLDGNFKEVRTTAFFDAKNVRWYEDANVPNAIRKNPDYLIHDVSTGLVNELDAYTLEIYLSKNTLSGKQVVALGADSSTTGRILLNDAGDVIGFESGKMLYSAEDYTRGVGYAAIKKDSVVCLAEDAYCHILSSPLYKQHFPGVLPPSANPFTVESRRFFLDKVYDPSVMEDYAYVTTELYRINLMKRAKIAIGVMGAGVVTLGSYGVYDTIKTLKQREEYSKRAAEIAWQKNQGQ